MTPLVQMTDSLVGSFNRADNATSGLLGRLTALAGVIGVDSALFAVLSKIPVLGSLLGVAATVGNTVAGGVALAWEAASMVANRPDLFVPIAGNPMLSAMGADFGIGGAIMGAAGGNGASGWPTSPSKTPMSGGGGGGTMPLPGAPKTPSSGRVWGDTEGVFAGLYDAPP
jgi:hypothetical protein